MNKLKQLDVTPKLFTLIKNGNKTQTTLLGQRFMSNEFKFINIKTKKTINVKLKNVIIQLYKKEMNLESYFKNINTNCEVTVVNFKLLKGSK